MGLGRAPLMHPRVLVAAVTLCAAAAARAQGPARVQVTAVPEFASVAPGTVLRVAVRLGIPDGYHLSWTNPGRTGLPTTIAWRTPSGIRVDGTQWPYPERDETAGLVSHVYRGTVVVVTRFLVAPRAPGGRAVLRAALSWGICGARCFPQSDTVEVRLRVQARAPETTAAWRALAQSLELLPSASADLTVHGAARGDSVHLTITGGPLGLTTADSAAFFPASRATAVVVPVERIAGGVTVTLPGGVLAARPGRLEGVLVADRPWLVGSRRRALAIDTVLQDLSGGTCRVWNKRHDAPGAETSTLTEPRAPRALARRSGARPLGSSRSLD
jgi:thiol:disulfide interchange protein DsbD